MHNLPQLPRKHTSIKKCENLTSDTGPDPAPTLCRKKSETYCLQVHDYEKQQSLRPCTSTSCTSTSCKSESNQRSRQPHYQQYTSAIAVISHQRQQRSQNVPVSCSTQRPPRWRREPDHGAPPPESGAGAPFHACCQTRHRLRHVLTGVSQPGCLGQGRPRCLIAERRPELSDTTEPKRCDDELLPTQRLVALHPIAPPSGRGRASNRRLLVPLLSLADEPAFPKSVC